MQIHSVEHDEKQSKDNGESSSQKNVGLSEGHSAELIRDINAACAIARSGHTAHHHYSKDLRTTTKN